MSSDDQHDHHDPVAGPDDSRLDDITDTGTDAPIDTDGGQVGDASSGDASSGDASSGVAAPVLGDGARGTAPGFSIDELTTLADNSAIRGELVVHHTSRDVRIAAGGFNALRVIAHFVGQSGRRRIDAVSPRTSHAANGWTGLAYTGVIGITWIPNLEPVTDTKVAFDPA